MGSSVIDAAGLQQLVSALLDRGYRVVGPTLSDNAIVLAELQCADDLPKGWGVDVGPGLYRLRRTAAGIAVKPGGCTDAARRRRQ